MKIILCIPCYNCENQIRRVLSDFDQELINLVNEIIVIDNCSIDGTIDSALSKIKEIHCSKIKLIKNDFNRGLGGSHQVAFNYGLEQDADFVGIIHGDHQAKTLEMKILISRAVNSPDKAAYLGSRFSCDSTLNNYSFPRTLGNRMLNFIISILTFRNIPDLGSGLNLFNLKYLSDRSFMSFETGFLFNVDLLLHLCKKKYPFEFVPITWSHADEVSNVKGIFRIGWKILVKVIYWRIIG